MRTSNKKAHNFIYYKLPFKGSNTFGEDFKLFYVVYSYGRHWILYLYIKDEDTWYGCNEKYSRSTTKHSSQLQPRENGNIKWLSQRELQKKKKEYELYI